MPAERLIILDRDGVLNAMVVDPEHGTVDSPLHPSQVVLMPGVEEALKELTLMGYALVIASNQPAAAKGKTTRANLQAVNDRVISLSQQQGGLIASSYLCFHRAEDGCACRKPRPGLLNAALADRPQCRREESWMVGDGVTDVAAGAGISLKTAFLAAHRCDVCGIVRDRGLSPDYWGPSLPAFAEFLRGCLRV